MAVRFLSGLVTGTVVSGLALGAVSVAAPPQAARGPDTAALEVPGASGFNQARDDTAARLPGLQSAPNVAGDTPLVGAPAPDDLSQVAEGATQPGARPEFGEAQADLGAPQPGAEDSGMPAPPAGQSGDDVDLASQSAGAPADLSISADPAQPGQPEVEQGAAYSAAPSTPDETDMPTPGEDAVIDESAAEENAAEQSAVEDSPDEIPTEQRAAESGAAEEGVSDDSAGNAAPDAAAEEESAPSSTIGNIADGVETGRLPSVGSAPATDDASGADDIADAPPPPAITAFAAPFDNPEGKPLMSIVLIDDGSSPIGLEALDAFPYPLSFAVNAAMPGAPEAMRRYRDAGFEVLAITDLPAGATARDTETTMQTVAAAVPEAVAVLEGTGEGLQISREASEQLAPILLESGQGLVLYSKGLETAPKLISRQGVPVGTIFRDFDANDQSATVIRRFLDQAAFKAGRDEGGVIMLGRLRPDTISALLLWGLQDRASRVALAPVSAVLTQGE
ncbi:hypothetical protein DC366_02170 [Pelagivirga sediminicola]|uniref:Divergent polysaccharide deacetylase family protein n=1 Tax=Pelagivirga sediminicola TaxID=2170575 RepID=A0A2T7GBI2_9RHOB|nr:divergent polysaccharide deacteylase family protein [Pelagivirga sediminicola]PVA11777.1 hypothetical protein DC366_02170 [Pelagivirga sediminicola]